MKTTKTANILKRTIFLICFWSDHLGATHLDTQTSLSIDSSTSVAQIVVEFDGVNACGGSDSGKSIEKLSKMSEKY